MMRDEVLELVISELGYDGSESLVRSTVGDISADRAISYLDAFRRLEIDAVYFIGSHPTVFFVFDESLDNRRALELQHKVWNHNRASRLIAVSSKCCWIFECDTPARSIEERDEALGLSIRAAADAVTVVDVFAGYRRANVVAPTTGALTNPDSRVDARLLRGLQGIREALLERGLSANTIMRLVTKSVFAKYLEDRGVLTSRFLETQFGSSSVQGILRSSSQTFALFRFLTEKFNGDFFGDEDVSIADVSGVHLTLIADFLDGHDIQTGQQSLWPFDFEYIPIQVLSSVYEILLHHDKKETGSFYTPSSVARFMISYAMQQSTSDQDNFRVIDPTCGSGLFLVEMYQYLVLRVLVDEGIETLCYSRLESILTTSIFGIDIDESAIEVASLGLYLALLDQLSPKAIWEQVKLPSLIGRNLFVQDAFEENLKLQVGSFSLVLGNPPWVSSLTSSAKEYISTNKLSIGDNQIAIALLWRAASLLSDVGIAAMLMPSKPLLHNRSPNATVARERIFGGLEVIGILDLSLFRKTLFVHSNAPAAAVFVRRLSGTDRVPIVHMAPRPSRLSASANAIMVASDEISVVDVRLQKLHPFTWKTLLVGSQRDQSLVEYLASTFQTLGHLADEQSWSVSSGYAVGNRAKYVPEMASLRRAESVGFWPFWIDSAEPNSELTRFERPRIMDTYLGAKLLIKQGVRRRRGILAAFTIEDVIFSNKTTSVASKSPDDIVKLKAITAVMNSTLVRYFMFMTATSWGVERDFIQQADIVSTPIFDLYANGDHCRELAGFTDRMAEMKSTTISPQVQKALDDLVFESYGLNSRDVQTILDGTQINLDMYASGLKSPAFSAPDETDLKNYISGFIGAFSAMLFDTTVTGKSLAQSSAHTLVRFSFDTSDESQHDSSRVVANQALQDFSNLVEGSGDKRVVFSRTVFIYGNRELSIIKPAERRFWNHTSGENDADQAVASLFQAGSN